MNQNKSFETYEKLKSLVLKTFNYQPDVNTDIDRVIKSSLIE